MAVDRGGLQYTIEARDAFSATTQNFRKEMRASKAAFRDFQASLKADRQSAKALRDMAIASRDVARSQRQRSQTSSELGSSERALSRFERKRLITLRNLRDQSKLLSDAEIRRERDNRRSAATAEKSASAVEQKARAEKAAARAAKEAERAERRLQEVRARDARTGLVRQERALRQQRSQELQQLREDIQARAAAQQAEERAQEQAQQNRLRQFAESQRTAEQLAQRQRRAQRTERVAAERVNAEVQAQKRLNQELFRRQVLLKQIDLLRARARSQFVSGDILGARDSVRRARELRREITGTESAARRMLFTFRRLVGILAIFTLARQAVAGFNNLVRAGLRFGDTIEKSTIGVAGLVATLGDVRNELGQSVNQAQELDLALGIASEQVEQLRQDSLQTVATFEQLLDTFQIAVGPGLAAGLDLDEVRQLTVDISQAASALGVPQNQLAEEVRSLLSGTIQARTTRIATALGITNADIRRLRETGELFDFLESEFSGFADAAQRQARRTLSGITTLVEGALGAVLGAAAEPLRQELLGVLGDILDDVLTIRDEVGNLQPNPTAVEAFRTIFDALRSGVQTVRQLSESLGFEGLQNVVQTIGSGLNVALQAGLGFAKAFLLTWNLVAGAVRATADLFRLSARQVGFLAGLLGQALGALIIFVQGSRLLGIEWSSVLRIVRRIGPAIVKAGAPIALFVAAIALLAKGFEKILERIFGVELGIKDTARLIGLGLAGAFTKVVEVVRVLGVAVLNGLSQALDTVISSARSKALGARAFIASLFGDEEETIRLFDEREAVELEAHNRAQARLRDTQEAIAGIRKKAAEEQLEIEEKIAEIIGDAAGEGAKGEGFDDDFINTRELNAALLGVQANMQLLFGVFRQTGATVSTASKPISELTESLIELEDELRETQIEFSRASEVAGLEGFGGQVEGIFTETAIKNAERLRGIRSALADTERQIAALRARGTPETDGTLVSLLRDEEMLRNAINNALELANELAFERAAVLAAQTLPALRQETALLRAQFATQRAVVAANVADAGAREQALLAAQGALATAQVERDLAREKADANIRALQARVQEARIAVTETGRGQKELEALQATLNAIRERRDLEQEILGLQIQQLQKERERAQQRLTGGFGEGVQEGLEQLRDELPTVFETALNLTRQFVTDFSRFAASSIVENIVAAQEEGVDRSELFKRAAGQFAQALATQILESVIQTLIQSILQSALSAAVTQGTAAATQLVAAEATSEAALQMQAAATTLLLAAIILRGSGGGGHAGGLVPPQGFHEGGKARKARESVPRIRGYAAGGRPPGVSGFDTVPAWLQPGEFVIRKSVVDEVGADVFGRINRGSFNLVPSVVAEAAGPQTGMQTGGLVSDRIASVSAATTRSGNNGGGEEKVVVVPAVVARDREMDRFTAGGRNALLEFMRENAPAIGAFIDQSRGGR